MDWNFADPLPPPCGGFQFFSTIPKPPKPSALLQLHFFLLWMEEVLHHLMDLFIYPNNYNSMGFYISCAGYDPSAVVSTADNIPLRVQVPNNHILAQNLYYNYYHPNPKYPITFGYMDPKTLNPKPYIPFKGTVFLGTWTLWGTFLGLDGLLLYETDAARRAPEKELLPPGLQIAQGLRV